jgi:hypothetical protein
VPRGMPGARSGGSGGDGSNSGDFGGDAGGAVTVWEVVSLLGKLLGTVAALKVVLYLLRVCLAMAWKSGGASHSELIHNLRSKCHPRWCGPAGAGWAWTGSPWAPGTFCLHPRACWRASVQGCTGSPQRRALAIASPGTCHLATRRERSRGRSWGDGAVLSPQAWATDWSRR